MLIVDFVGVVRGFRGPKQISRKELGNPFAQDVSQKFVRMFQEIWDKQTPSLCTRGTSGTD